MGSSRVRVLCRPGVAQGFGLAGLVADAVPPELDPSPRLEEALQQPEVGVVLIEESIFDALSPDTKARLERSTQPLVVPFPGPSWSTGRAAEERVVELLRHAIGYRVRLT
jgi:vacuolar-type H+-ATPase subunit F/Vma7